MENRAIEIKILGRLQNELSEAERKEVDYLLETSPEFIFHFNETKQLWEDMDMVKVPEPSLMLKTNFQAVLKTFELVEAHTKKSIWHKTAGLFAYKPKYNWAYALLLIGVGVLVSWLFFIPQNNAIKNLSQEVNEARQLAMLGMLENNTAVERMKAVSYTQELKNIDDKIITALFTTLNNDENENVRLATLDALVRFADNPQVREELVASLLRQDSELMQVALANVMLQLQEKRSVHSLKKLLENKNINTLVKEKLEQTVKDIETSSL
jgi:hypothetical protein